MIDISGYQGKVDFKNLEVEYVTIRAEEDGTYTLGWFEAQIYLEEEWYTIGEQRRTKEEAVADIVDHMSRQTSPHVYRAERQSVTLHTGSLAAAWLTTPGCTCRPIVLGDGGDEHIYMADWFDCPAHGTKEEQDGDID